jgi:hypothetical protein
VSRITNAILVPAPRRRQRQLKAMQINEDPTPDEEEILCCMDPAVLESYQQLKAGLRDALREIERQHKRNLGWLRKPKARSEQIAEKDEEKRQKVENRQAEFRRRVRDLVNGWKRSMGQ